MIVKVQRPLAGSVPGSGILVYDEERRHTVEMDPDGLPDWLTRALENNPKAFAEATFSQGKWRFKRIAKWQHW